MTTRQGGNGDVRIEDGFATKTLRRKSTNEKQERFKREVKVLQRIKRESIGNIVEVIDFDLDATLPWYKMRAYDGTADDVLSQTAGNVADAASLLIPVAKSLQYLRDLNEPIFHRDLKPDNILLDRTPVGDKLVIADFGCAYTKTDSDDRLTQDFRAVGAMAFRAPEYHYGRVEDVTEKGDIFSLGKLFWYLINGIPGDVFPYTLWHPLEYNLRDRLPNALRIGQANAIIAAATHHDPTKRMTYEALISALENITTMPPHSDNKDLRDKALQFEAERTVISESV